MSPDFMEDVSGFLARLKRDAEKYRGNEAFQNLMRRVSDGRVSVRWGKGLDMPFLPLSKPNLIWVRYLISAPFIYMMIVPILFMDISVSLYQALCFRLWKLPQVKRSRFIVIDRHRLGYLKWFQKIHCLYCGYANGVMAYAKMISGETERYWCPIKHERDIEQTHDFYIEFADYDDPEGWDNLHSGGLENWP